MRLFIYLAIAFGVFIKNIFPKRRKGLFQKHASGIQWLRDEIAYKNGQVTILFGLSFLKEVNFILAKEQAIDRYFNKSGFSKKYFTGDKNFDDKIYVTCDHPVLQRVLRDNSTVRETVLSLFNEGVQRIYTDGKTLWCETNNQEPDEKHLKDISTLVAELNKTENAAWTSVRDPFAKKAMVIQALFWSLFTFGWLKIMDFSSFPTYIDDGTPFWGFPLGLLLIPLSLATIYFIFRVSSRGHMVLILSSIPILFGMPVLGPALFYEINSIQVNAPHAVHAMVAKMEEFENRKRNGYTCFVTLSSTEKYHGRIIHQLDTVSETFYKQTTVGDNVILYISDGLLGSPWIDKITASPK
jgi:hypothetical protein